MATAGQILEGAYNRSTSNDPGHLALDPELLAHLDRVYQRAWALIARARIDQFGVSTTSTLLGVPPTGALPTTLIDLTYVTMPDGTSVSVIPAADRARLWQLAPCVYRRGYTLISRNSAGDPTAGTVLSVDWLDAPAALVARGTVIDPRWPTRHLQLLVDTLAVYLSVKDDGRSANDHAKIVAELKTSAAALAAEFQLAPADLEWLHADVERAGAA